MNAYRVKLGENGRVVIPAAVRRQLHVVTGEDLVIRVEDNELRICSLKYSLEKARSLVRKYTKNKNLVDQLKAMRQEDFDKK